MMFVYSLTNLDNTLQDVKHTLCIMMHLLEELVNKPPLPPSQSVRTPSSSNSTDVDNEQTPNRKKDYILAVRVKYKIVNHNYCREII